MARFKCTDNHGNIAYIHQDRNGDWRCTLANRTSAAFSYALGYVRDEMGIVFALDDAKDDDERLAILQKAAGSGRTIEKV